MPTPTKPRIAVLPGDPSGIGPELVARLLAEPGNTGATHILVVGDAHVVEMGQRQAGTATRLAHLSQPAADWWRTASPALCPIETLAADEVQIAEATLASGRSALRQLDAALDLAARGIVDGILFAPFNKAAMHQAGMGVEDEHRYMAKRMGFTGYISEINVLEGLMTTRVTSHIPLKEVAGRITRQGILDAISLADETLKRAGHAKPRIAVCALNPHAGDGGNFGREEIDLIAPTVREAAAQGIAADGPWPSDTIFLRARSGKADAVVIMYHDQGQIAMKLMGFERGVTVSGGLPVPAATPAHGTAFDIAGKGQANPRGIQAAFDLVCRMAAAAGTSAAGAAA
ncbi:MAG: 4-hydroxythreonine-4-phosphate dehydrogenase PdxA [Hyphomicrobiaceae bacterium]